MRRVNASIMILSITTIFYSTSSEITIRDAGARAHGFSFTGIEKVAKPQFLEKFKEGAEKKRIMVLLKNGVGNTGLRISEKVALMKEMQSAIRTRLDPNQAKLDLNMAAITARSFFAPAASCRESNYTNTHNHMLKNGAL
jgi:hypothetical protein